MVDELYLESALATDSAPSARHSCVGSSAAPSLGLFVLLLLGRRSNSAEGIGQERRMGWKSKRGAPAGIMVRYFLPWKQGTRKEIKSWRPQGRLQ